MYPHTTPLLLVPLRTPPPHPLNNNGLNANHSERLLCCRIAPTGLGLIMRRIGLGYTTLSHIHAFSIHRFYLRSHFSCYTFCVTLFVLHFLCYTFYVTLFVLYFLCYTFCVTLFVLNFLCYTFCVTLFVIHF